MTEDKNKDKPGKLEADHVYRFKTDKDGAPIPDSMKVVRKAGKEKGLFDQTMDALLGGDDE